MSSSQKKVILRRFAGDVLHGYLPLSGFVAEAGVSLLNLEGRLVAVPLPEIKTICFVRDFNVNDVSDPERLQRRIFLTRPRGEGVWIRILFRQDADPLEGLAPSDESLLDSLVLDAGIAFIPPDTRANTQRIYVPRLAIDSLTLLAVITSPSKRQQTPTRLRGAADAAQVSLFETAEELYPLQKKGTYGRG